MTYEIIWKYNGNKEYISGILELYVYGLLSETEMKKLLRWKNNPEVNADVIAIEKRLCLYPLVLLRFIRWKFTEN
jgi:hypothetical protein